MVKTNKQPVQPWASMLVEQWAKQTFAVWSLGGRKLNTQISKIAKFKRHHLNVLRSLLHDNCHFWAIFFYIFLLMFLGTLFWDKWSVTVQRHRHSVPMETWKCELEIWEEEDYSVEISGGSGRWAQVVWRKLWSPLRAAASYLPDNSKMEIWRTNCRIFASYQLFVAIPRNWIVLSCQISCSCGLMWARKGALFPRCSKKPIWGNKSQIGRHLLKNDNIIWQC